MVDGILNIDLPSTYCIHIVYVLLLTGYLHDLGIMHRDVKVGCTTKKKSIFVSFDENILTCLSLLCSVGEHSFEWSRWSYNFSLLICVNISAQIISLNCMTADASCLIQVTFVCRISDSRGGCSEEGGRLRYVGRSSTWVSAGSDECHEIKYILCPTVISAYSVMIFSPIWYQVKPEVIWLIPIWYRYSLQKINALREGK